MATCDPQTLISEAACFACLSPGFWQLIELQLLCEINAAGGGGASKFVGTVAINGGSTLYSLAHGLPGVPRMVNAVLACTTNDAGTGLSAGQESNIEDWILVSIGQPSVDVYRDASNVYISLAGGLVANNWEVISAAGATYASPTTFNNFIIKVYAWF